MRRALSVLLLASCGGGPAIDLDAGCGQPGTAVDQPALSCPAVDLGCLPASGAMLTPSAGSVTCDGSHATVVCTPGLVTPGITSGQCTARAASGAEAQCSFAIHYRVTGAPQLVCPSAITSSCTGVRTAIDLPAPQALDSCDGTMLGAAQSDAPANGFVVGSTTVTFSATGASCTLPVTITDTTPPRIDCGDAQLIVRTAPGQPIVVAPPTATDTCDDMLELAVDPAPTGRGFFFLNARATDHAGLSANCSQAVRVLDAFAPTELRIVSATLAADGSTDVTIGWTASSGADVNGVRVERAESASGPWTALATLPPSTTTFTDASMPSPRAYYRLVALVDTTEGGTSETLRALAIAADGYDLSDQSVPGLTFTTSLYGVVRHPIDTSVAPPLAVFMHGNHGNCRPATGEDECMTLSAQACDSPGYTTTPNAEGYVYLMETLAANGIASVSIGANALNCRDDYIPERVQLLLEHLRRWASWPAGGSPLATDLAAHVNLSEVVLFGHSRGGEAVSSAPEALAATPITGIELAGVFAVGPTDFHAPRPNGVRFAVLLPGCDGDVRTLEGLHQYDRGLDPTDTHSRSQVLYIGADHNFFNTEWRVDDNDELMRACDPADLVGATAQRGMLEMVLADWIGAVTSGARVPAYLRADAALPALVGTWAAHDLDLRWSYAAGARRVIDDFTAAGAPNVNSLGGANTYSGLIADPSCTGTCAATFTHLRSAIRVAWQSAPASASFAFPDLDASSAEALSFRFSSRIASINAGITTHDLAIRARDSAGNVVEIPLSSVGRLPQGYHSNFEQEVLATVRVPVSVLRAATPAIDLAHLSAVELGMPIASGSPQGSIWAADLDLAGD